MNKLLLIVTVLLMMAVCSYANETPSLELGKTLFETTDLGSKGLSCASCHPQGKGLDMISDFNDTELKDIINACLRDAVGAEMISPESQEMNALLAYVRVFQKNK